MTRCANHTGSRHAELIFVAQPDGRSDLSLQSEIPHWLQQAFQAAYAGQEALARTYLIDTHLQGIGEEESEAFFLLGQIFFKLQDWQPAEYWYQRTLAIAPAAMVHYQLGRLYAMTGQTEAVVACNRRAYEADSEQAYILREYAGDRIAEGELQEGIDLLKKAVALAPQNAQLHSLYLLRLNYLSDISENKIREAYVDWACRHAPLDRVMGHYANACEPNRKLRVAYLCSEFRDHVTWHNLWPLLKHHDRTQVTLIAYACTPYTDSATERYKTQFDLYRDIHNLSDEAAAQVIRNDGVDILVAIGGHVPCNRLPVLGYKPAPIQVDYGAVPTTGMPQVDYRITDAVQDSSASEPLYTEQAVYLKTGVECYEPASEVPDVGPLPALNNGYVTFGCFNNRYKMTKRTICLWAEVLKANPTACLLLKFKQAHVPEVQKTFRDQFKDLGVDPDRLEFYGWLEPQAALDLFNRVDIALDTLPYNGCVTSLESLWMGVPVISRVGGEAVFWPRRKGVGLLSRIGLEFFGCSSDDEYVAKATALAQNVRSLGQIRASLRSRMLAQGSICDVLTFVRDLETAYRLMWYRWCRSQGVETPRLESERVTFGTQGTRAINDQSTDYWNHGVCG